MIFIAAGPFIDPYMGGGARTALVWLHQHTAMLLYKMMGTHVSIWHVLTLTHIQLYANMH